MDTFFSLLNIAAFVDVLGFGVAATCLTPKLCRCGFYTCSYCGYCHNPICSEYEACSEV